MAADAAVRQIMRDFAQRTGLASSDRPPTRYLWTDAFAVCNFLGMFVAHGDDEALRLARRLVEQTHWVLGRHRSDDPRSGWISGLSEEEGERHPTRGGLRIGKRLPERKPSEPDDAALEWDRDGQYFHYLTRWMHALECVTRVTGDLTYHRWAVELVEAVHPRFTGPPSSEGPTHLYWKMSTDLTRPQVASMGHHDPLDGFLSYCEVQAAGATNSPCDLSSEIDAMRRLCRGRRGRGSWETDDALGIGGLLCDASRLAQLTLVGALTEPALLDDLLQSSQHGLEALLQQHPFRQPPERRLAFRELGLAIGLHATRRLRELLARHPSAFRRDRSSAFLEALARYEPLAGEIASFWLEASHRESPAWRAHRDTNEVMLATSLAPDGYLAS
jgi:hypothetical protein